MFEDVFSQNWWGSLYKDIRNYLSSCVLCAEMNTGYSPKIPLHPLNVPEGHFCSVHVDLLKIHTPSRGFNYILVIIYYEEFILKFGACKHLCIISDNEFINKWSKALNDLLGFKSIRTSVYKPTSIH